MTDTDRSARRPEEKSPDDPKPAAKAVRSTPRRGRRLAWIAGLAVAVVLVALTAGYVIGRSAAARAEEGAAATAESPTKPTIWYCSMHPQITSTKPGKCPICFMDLIPLEGSPAGPRQVVLSPEAMALAEIQTTPVRRRVVTNNVRMVGKIDYDETRVADITAWIPGRLDRLYVDYTGITVRKGDHLVYLYSPDLIVAQRELLQAQSQVARATSERTREIAQMTLASTEEKLRLWGLLDEQIEAIKQKGEPDDHMTIYAPQGGIVVRKHANEGAYVQTGTKIYTIADLSTVWVFFDAYESDVPWLRYGQEVEFTTESYPGEIFKGRIAFIDPVLNEKTRTVNVRVNVPNEDMRLKPGMFVHATVESRLAEGGQVLDPGLAGKWICPMHPEIVKDQPGTCDVCGMDLLPADELGFLAPEKAARPPLVIPASAPLITGKRAVVYVRVPKEEQPTFEGRDVLLGYRAGDYYIVRHGLDEGELVVTKGNFKLDSELQIKAEPSMMRPTWADAEAPAIAGGEGVTQTPAEPLEVPAEFRVALGPVYQAYLDTTAALAADDLAAAKEGLESLVEAIDGVDAAPLGDDARSRWARLRSRILFAAHEGLDGTSRLAVRRRVRELSSAMIGLVQGFGHAVKGPIVQVHCPMAFQGLGADWLQQGAEVRNPYFGPRMLGCGDTVATFQSQAPLEVPEGFRQQLTGLFDAYLQLQEALADDKLTDAEAAWDRMRAELKPIGPEGLGDREAAAWTAARAELERNLGAGWKEPNVDDVRQQFEAVSGTMLALADAFGNPREEPLYRVFCPMAFKNQGAPWLQSGDKVANPYFGHKMLRCGKIERKFPAAAAPHDEEATP